MQKTMRSTTRRGERSIGFVFGRGFIAAVAVQLIFLALAATLTRAGTIAESAMPLVSVICVLLCSFAGAFICARSAPKLALPLALGVGAAAFLVNCLPGIFLGSGEFSPLIPAAFIVGAAVGGVLSAAGKGRK